MYNEDFSGISIYTKPFVVKAVCRRNLTFPIWEFFFAKCSNFHVPFSCICRLDTVIWLSLLRLYIFFTHCYVVLMCAFRVTSVYLPPFVCPIWLISTLIDVCLYNLFFISSSKYIHLTCTVVTFRNTRAFTCVTLSFIIWICLSFL